MIKPRIIKSQLWGNVNGIALFPFIFVRDKKNKTLVNHELIHFAQQKELWVIGFYIMYLIYSIKGYRQNPFEKEAYDNSRNLNYLNTRKAFAFTGGISQMQQIKNTFAKLIPKDKLNHFFWGTNGFIAFSILFNIWLDTFLALWLSLLTVCIIAAANEFYFWKYEEGRFSSMDIIYTITSGVLITLYGMYLYFM